MELKRKSLKDFIVGYQDFLDGIVEYCKFRFQLDPSAKYSPKVHLVS